MANPIELPQVNIRPDAVGGGQMSPNPLDAFVTNYFAARAQRSSESAQARAHEIEQGRLDLLREDLKFRQEQQRTQTANIEAQGGGAQALIKALAPAIEAQSQYTPPGQLPPVLTALGLTPQNQQQGPQQPAQSPNAPPQAQTPQQDPMAIFSGIVSKLPASAVPDFIKQFGGVAQAAQAKKDQGKALDQAEKMTTGLLGPDQAGQMKLARMLFEGGAPSEIWQSALPRAQMDLAKGVEEVRSAGSRRDADRLATKELVRLGLQPVPPQGMSEFIVDGAAKMLIDYVAGVRRDARQATIARAAAQREEDVKGLEGTALEIAASNPDWSPKQIKAALKATPSYASLGDGEISKAAFEAPKKAQQLTAPASDAVAKARVVYGPGRAAMAVVNAMDAKGEALGIAARAAQVTSGEAAKIGMGSGAGIGMLGGPLTSIAAGAAGGAAGMIAAPVIRGLGRASMSADQQRLWTAAQTLAASVYRPESGGAVTPDEIRTTLDRYIPLTTDSPGTRKLKRTLRNELDKTLANISQLPPQLQQNILNGVLSQHEQQIGRLGGSVTGGGGTTF